MILPTDQEIDERLVRLSGTLPAAMLTRRPVQATRKMQRITASVAAVCAVLIAVIAGSMLLAHRATTQPGVGPNATGWPSAQAAMEALTAARGYTWRTAGAPGTMRAVDPDGVVIDVWSPAGHPAVVSVIEQGAVPRSEVQELVLGIVAPGATPWLADSYPSLAVNSGSGNMTIVHPLPGGLAVLGHDLVAGSSTWTLTVYPDGVAELGTVEPSPVASSAPSAQPSQGIDAAAACESIKGSVPLVVLRSGDATVAGAYPMDQASLATYLATVQAGVSPVTVTGPVASPGTIACLIDGDFDTRTSGPPGHDTTARRILVLIQDGTPMLWAMTRDPAALPTLEELSGTTSPAPGTSASPNPSGPASSASGVTFVLASHPGGDCGGEGDPRPARIRADAADPDHVWLELRGKRLQTFWPEGTTVRFGGDKATIRDAAGSVIATAGQRLGDTSLSGCMTGDRIYMFQYPGR